MTNQIANTRTIAFDADSRTWVVVTEEMETVGNWNVITQYWARSMQQWVTVGEA